MVLEAEMGRGIMELVQKIRTDNPERIALGEEVDGIPPAVQIEVILCTAESQLASDLVALQKAELLVFLELLPDR